MFRAIIHASEVLTGAGIRRKNGRFLEEADLGRIEDGALVYSLKKRSGRLLPHQVVWVGETSQLPKKFARAPQKNLKNKCAVIPGLVDCHTHLVFAGDRSEEFADRCAGITYEEIAKRGGGVLSTVHATRQASHKELLRLGVARVRETMRFGVRTLEIKSGYGLSFESEIKILKVIQALKIKFPEMTFRSTFLGAHAFPKEMARQEYIKLILDKMLPEVAVKNLAECCDVFVDHGYFSLDESKAILKRAKELGLLIKVHADELFNTESSALAASMNALSADHLLKISENGIQKLVASETVAVLLPGTAFYLKTAQAPARKLLDGGAAVALATDFNPGTCMTLSLPVIMTLAAIYLGMTRAEIFGAVTFNGAKALGLQDQKGTLELGRDADFAILPFQKFEEMYYRFAWVPPA